MVNIIDSIYKSKLEDTPTIVNIYNFIRKTVYPSGEFVQDDFDTVVYQMEILKQYGLPATYALKYDALIDEKFSKLILENIDEYDEVGVWWEIDKQLAEKSGVKWKGKTPVDDHVDIGYSLGYKPEEREKMVDTYMRDFKEVFGYYPKSVGSWVIDIVTFKYFKEKYGVVAGALCRDQIGTDGFTLWGGYFNQAYYPSKLNEYMPAQTKKMQLDLPIFKLLGPDPIYSFEDGLRESVKGVYTLEPASIIGQTKLWVDWLFERYIEEPVLGFSHVQVGQENTFLWNTMYKGYKLQIDNIASLAKEGKVRVETLEESGAWFKNRYELTPPTSLAASKDWNINEDLRILWYNSRFYRVSLLWEKNKLSIRDFHLFNEMYKSRYYEKALNENESIFDALPILNAHYWSDKDIRASISMVKVGSCGKINYITGNEPEFSTEGNSIYNLKWKCDNENEFNIVCDENKIIIQNDSEKLGDNVWALHINKLPVLKRFNSKKLICEHNDFQYSISLEKGEFRINEDEGILVFNEENKIIIVMSERPYKQEEFFKESYINNKKEVDSYIPRYKRIKSKSKIKLRAFKPKISPQVVVEQKPAKCIFTIDNPNKVGNIYYTLDGSDPKENSIIYNKPILVDKSCKIKAVVIKDGFNPSEIVEGEIYTTLPITNIESDSNPVNDTRYNKRGVYDLIDGRKGSKDYRDGCWLGYHEDLDVTVDLGKIMDIKNITVGFLQDTRAWIYYPIYVEFEISDDGEKFESIGRVDYKNTGIRKEVGVENIIMENTKLTRYIRIFAKNEGVCPNWSIMAGEGPAFMFVDQITVN